MSFVFYKKVKSVSGVFFAAFQMHLVLVCLLLGLLEEVSGAPDADEIKYLPGLSKQPSFKHYSGYFNVADNKHLHYWCAGPSSFHFHLNDPKNSLGNSHM